MLVYEQAGNAYMRFNNKMHRNSPFVQAQNLLLSRLASKETMEKLQESDEYMGASIEN